MFDDACFFNIYKPAGITSNLALSIFKRKTSIKKCGFAGTLDPFAEGILPIAVNRGTKQINVLIDVDKEYECIAEFGKSTDSGDLTGQEIAVSEFIPDIADINAVIKEKFIGSILQCPPLYSAVKFNGKRLCDIMRSDNVEIDELRKIVRAKEKIINVYSFELIEKIDNKLFRFIISCGKGTYIRQLIVDLAHMLGNEAHLVFLRRTRVGNFDISNSVELDFLNKENFFQYKLYLPK